MMLRIALPALLSLMVIGVGLLLSLERGGSEQIIPSEPTVEGRIWWGSTGSLKDGSGYVSLCEADAHVRVEKDTIIKILEHGERPPITIGDKIERDLSYDPTYTEEDVKETGELPVTYDLWVYRDEEGVIRTGCSPESTIIIDDVAKTYAEWVAEGKLQTPRPGNR